MLHSHPEGDTSALGRLGAGSELISEREVFASCSEPVCEFPTCPASIMEFTIEMETKKPGCPEWFKSIKIFLLFCLQSSETASP